MEVIDGTFDFLIERLRSGGIDFIIGPVRGLDPSLGVVETVLFDDRYALVVRRGHPLTRKRQIRRQDLLAYDWVAPPPDTPRRAVYDALLAGLDRMPRSTLQTSSPNLTRAILTETDRITLLSRYESRAEQEMGFLTVLPFAVPHPARRGAGHYACRLAADGGAGTVPPGAARSGARPAWRRSGGAGRSGPLQVAVRCAHNRSLPKGSRPGADAHGGATATWLATERASFTPEAPPAREVIMRRSLIGAATGAIALAFIVGQAQPASAQDKPIRIGVNTAIQLQVGRDTPATP